MPIENMQAVITDGAQAGQRVVRLKGPLSIHTVFEFQSLIRAETAPHVIIDFSGVPFLDSSGSGIAGSGRMSRLRRRAAGCRSLGSI